MGSRSSCFAVALSILAACTADPTTPAETGAPPPVASAGSGGQIGAAAGSAGASGRSSVTGGVPGTGGTSAAGNPGSAGSATGGSGGSAGSVATGGSAGSAGSVATGGSAGGSAVPPTFATVRAVLMDTSTPYSCYGGICHDFPENPYFKLKKDGVALSDDELHAMLLGYMTKNCGAAVNTANPAESGLVKLLKADCGETGRMPFGKCSEDGDEGCVPPAHIAAIQQWIAAGAPR